MGGLQFRMILFRLRGVGHCKGGKSVVDDFRFSHIASESSWVAAARMRPRKRPAAEARIGAQRALFHNFADGAKAPVLELANIKIPPGFLVLSPAEKNIACRLHRTLAFDHTNALMGEIFWRRCAFF